MSMHERVARVNARQEGAEEACVQGRHAYDVPWAVQGPGHVAGGDAAAGEASAACEATDEPGPEHGAGGVDGERAEAAEGQGDLHSDRVSLDAEEVGGGVRDMARPSTGAGDASWLQTSGGRGGVGREADEARDAGSRRDDRAVGRQGMRRRPGGS